MRVSAPQSDLLINDASEQIPGADGGQFSASSCRNTRAPQTPQVFCRHAKHVPSYARHTIGRFRVPRGGTAGSEIYPETARSGSCLFVPWETSCGEFLFFEYCLEPLNSPFSFTGNRPNRGLVHHVGLSGKIKPQREQTHAKGARRSQLIKNCQPLPNLSATSLQRAAAQDDAPCRYPHLRVLRLVRGVWGARVDQK